jgi:hypothetical protein
MTTATLLPLLGRSLFRPALVLLPSLLCLFSLAGVERLVAEDQAVKNGPAQKPGYVEVQYVDGSTMKLTVLDERLELVTAYGKLLIPVADIRHIEFGTRVPAEVARRIEAAVADLGHNEYRRRHTATQTLQDLGVKAYPALLEAAKSSDQEVARRAEQLLEKIRETAPRDQLEVRPFDVVHTEHSQIAGRLALEAVKVRTFQFGEQMLKLADLRSLQLPGARVAPKQDLVQALPDPGHLAQFSQQIGKTFVFQVTGNAGGGGVWGTDVYTMDTNLSAASVHAGVLRQGQAGLVRVTILGPQVGFQPSVRHGVMSQGYGAYAGYRINK